MTYKEYMEKCNCYFGHKHYEYGILMLASLEELLLELKDGGYACPDNIEVGIPVKITIDPEDAIDKIEQQLNNDFSGEDYEMPEGGKEFLRTCFQEYNEKYAKDSSNYCDTVTVEVPDEMKYEMGGEE